MRCDHHANCASGRGNFNWNSNTHKSCLSVTRIARARWKAAARNKSTDDLIELDKIDNNHHVRAINATDQSKPNDWLNKVTKMRKRKRVLSLFCCVMLLLLLLFITTSTVKLATLQHTHTHSGLGVHKMQTTIAFNPPNSIKLRGAAILNGPIKSIQSTIELELHVNNLKTVKLHVIASSMK